MERYRRTGTAGSTRLPAGGFTLVELLIVVVILGVLAAIAIPQYNRTKEQAYVATVKSDLDNAMTEAEAYFAEHEDYGMTASYFQTSGDVTVDDVVEASSPAALCVQMSHARLSSDDNPWMIANVTSSGAFNTPADYVPDVPEQASC